jgi:glycosyltransferase involved in cell wall biosynthesis
MKCAIIHNHPIHYKHLLFQRLKARGLEFEVIFAAARSSIRHENIGLRADLYKYRIAFDGPYESAPPARRALQTWKAISEINPDVAIIGGCDAAECWAAWLWAQINEKPVVMWYQSNEFDYPNRPWHKEALKKLYLRRVNRAHVYGVSSEAYLLKLGLPAERIDVKGAVANVEALSIPSELKTYSRGRTKRLLYVGRLAEEKNVGVLLQAIANATKIAGKPLWMLTIAGVGPLEQELRQLCVTLGIQKCVEFKGYVPQSELPLLFRQADLFVLPSRREPWGLVALEAMLGRIPIAVSTQCGCAEDLVNPGTGWKFSPWTDEALTEILLKLPDMGSAQLARMGSACHDLASGYSAAACAERIIRSLNQITGQTDARTDSSASVDSAV